MLLLLSSFWACGSPEPTEEELEKVVQLEKCSKNCDAIMTKVEDCKEQVGFCDAWNTVHCAPSRPPCEEQKAEAKIDWKRCIAECEMQQK